MDTLMPLTWPRLIEHGFPCHQVGAETQRERGASSALPPVYFLHVWWARRPLTPSRAAILASLSPADLSPDAFLRQLGIEQRVVEIGGEAWVLTRNILDRVRRNKDGTEVLPVDAVVLRRFEKEQQQRVANLRIISELEERDPALADDPAIAEWRRKSQPLIARWVRPDSELIIRREAGNPAWFSALMEIGESCRVRLPNLYGYDRAFVGSGCQRPSENVVLDPTAGGGSIPFEALRLGHRVIANELNPVATTILYATLDYPARFGANLIPSIRGWGERLLSSLDVALDGLAPRTGPLPDFERAVLANRLQACPKLIDGFDSEEVTTFLFCREVTCPTCSGQAPLLNSCWLAKNDEEPWAARVITDGRRRGGRVRFETYRVVNGRGPSGEDPDFGTVADGVGSCIHCRQAIPEDEIKAQAQGCSENGRWTDRLYCVVAVRLEPRLDEYGRPQRYTSGERKGEIKTRKISFFRSPNDRDLAALTAAERRLAEKWPAWEAAGLIPTELIPEDSNYNRGHRLYGMTRWCELFTPRQLLGHVTLVEELRRLTPEIIAALGEERGRAVVTYLQFAIDKGVDYNSNQTRWIPQRGSISGTFSRHNFSIKWTFGEMIFSGPNSGAVWGLDQVIDAYRSIAELVEPIHRRVTAGAELPVKILHGTAAHLGELADGSVDLVCMDPPYYNNVQHGELSDFYYVWQRRTLRDLYPEVYARRLVNRTDEAVANPARDGSADAASVNYERMMGEIFAECRRVLKPDGLMTVMFTHVSQDAWEALTRSLIEADWIITSTLPVESEFAASMHQMDQAAAASSVFLTCRKRDEKAASPESWTGIGGTGVQQRIRQAVERGLRDFESLHLNAVDEMVACYGRALQVLSEHWPVMDGDEPVSPLRAMNEASNVVAANQITRITKGRIAVAELDGETRMALTMVGIFGLAEFAWDAALNLSRSLGIALHGAPPADTRSMRAASASTLPRRAGQGAPAAPRRSRTALRHR
jgi:putative DNA methylase